MLGLSNGVYKKFSKEPTLMQAKDSPYDRFSKRKTQQEIIQTHLML